ncbi:hypothetical protein TSOC_011341, partial [Tetrabaena socialis]
LDDPPAYVVAKRGRLPESWKPLIRAAYPFLQPLHVVAPPPGAAGGEAAARGGAAAAVLDAVATVARAMPLWQVVHVDSASSSGSSGGGGGLVMEAVSTTRLLRFKDDIVVRIRPEARREGGGKDETLRVDVRSRSRVGRGDLGTNAARIRLFLSRLREELVGRGVDVV